MIDRKLLQRVGPNGHNVSLKQSQETLVVFACSLLWPVVDSYYAALLFTLSMVKNKSIEANAINKRIQWLSESLFEDKVIPFFEACN